ncbi:MAG: hypothetical protein AVDCRST_MAG79-2773 [uncultured Thermoleophilia bacterium]|uniref:Lipopolysaccharide assembly protein A domain-containing protein n=1 Tax=uncultured Thermoleophilia bacterium TaxID=1497501 RepID=A0A6J4UIT6_9ACTN|nr:MAG: hypothetical protein AVDCRST_MAG79-2773 [uncultured Thermoleophilia bacterium]
MKLPRGRADPERLVYGLLALLALIVIYLVAFVLSNTTTVPVSFVLFDTDASLIWVMLICTLLGLVAGVAASRLVTGRRAGGSGSGRGARTTAGTAPVGARPMPAATSSADADTDPSPPAGGAASPPAGGA